MSRYSNWKREWEDLATKHTPEYAFDFPECDDTKERITGKVYVFALSELVIIAEITLTWQKDHGLEWTMPANSRLDTRTSMHLPVLTSLHGFIDSMSAYLQAAAGNLNNMSLVCPPPAS
jgi:hypothetical protein